MFLFRSKLGMPDCSLGYAAERRMVVVARCKQCGREAKAYARDLATHYGKHRDYRTLKFRRAEYDPGTCIISLEPVDFNRVSERIVWKPVKVKGQ